MKSIRTFLLLGSALLVCSATAHAQLATYKAQPTGSKVKIDGTSTVHDWTMEGSIIGGSLEIDSAFLASPTAAKPGKIDAKVTVMIPVRSLKSGKDSMDAVMQDAMKQEAHPRIEYRLNELSLKEAPKSNDGPFVFDSKGELVISGTTNKVSFPVTIAKVDGGKLKATGSADVKMTAYGVQPPAPKIALGLVKTGDDVKVSWEWLAAPAK